MRCWLCGVEPAGAYEVMSAELSQPVRVVPVRPSGDHRHAERPPTPDELRAAGRASLMRIMQEHG